MTVTSTNQKIPFAGNGSTTVFAYNFKIFAQTDLLVILRSATGTETTQGLTSKYTVSGVGATSGGNVTMGTAPPSGTTLVIQRVQPQLQGLDLVPNDPFPAQSMEDALDKLVFNVQTLNEEVGRAIKASTTNTIGNTEFTISATDRANKLFSFDSSGNLNIAQELGTFRGNWAANTSYAVRDLVKDTSTGNIFIVITAHTSSGSQPITTNTDAAKWALIVDAASATTSKNAAAASATASANSATASSNSATTSGNSATTSGNSATNSGNSATAAGNSATAAGNSATAAAASLTTFQQQYHGAASSNPTANLTVGDLYFKTGSGGGLRVYNGSAWVNAAFDVSGALINTNNLSDVSSAATALANLGVSSTAAEINTLDAVPRGSIIYGNASAATARLSKGATGTVLTAGANDISWVAAGGGGEQTFTATGAITAGRPVGLNSNGTISSLVSPFGPSGSQSPAFAAEYNNVDYNSSNNTVTGFVSDTSGGSGGYLLQVASIDASLNITSGTAVRVPGSDRGVFTAQNQNARDLSTGKYLCIFQETNPGVNLRAAVATVSGTSVSFGGEQQLGSSSEGQDFELVYSGTANKFISFYIADSNYIYARIYTVSGNSVSVSSQITVVSSNTGLFDVRLDPSTSKIILAYSDNSDSGKLKSKICYLNGSTVSSGSVVTVDSATIKSSQQIYLTEDTNANKIVVSYVRTSPQLNYIAIGTVNAGNNTITFGTPKTGAEGASATAVPFFVSTDNTIGLYSSQNNNLCPIKISGTSFDYGDKIASFGAVLVYVSGRSGFHSGGTLPQIKKPVFPKYVGLAAENISNGASGKVTVIGGINTQQSSLIAGLPYGMPFLSEYSTTLTLTNSLVNKVGNAMSSSAIYVKAGEV